MSETNNAPYISVVIALYNCEAYIEECLQSLKSQTFTNFEAICVDDGSTDDGYAKAKASVRDDERFIFEALPENKGQSAARNVALEKAQGSYIVLLDADDYLVPEALQKLANCAQKHDLDELYFSAQSFYDSRESHKKVQESYEGRLSFDGVTSGQELFTFFQTNGQFYPQGAFRMVRRSLIESNHIRFYEGIIHEDLLYTFRVLALSNRSSFLNEALYMRRIRAGSTMTENSSGSLRSVYGHFICVVEMRKWLYEHAEELEEEFVPAITESLAEFLLKASYDWQKCECDEDKEKFLKALPAQERLHFYEEVIQRGSAVIKLEQSYLNSKTYRFGDALLKVPRAVKDTLKASTDYNKKKS